MIKYFFILISLMLLNMGNAQKIYSEEDVSSFINVYFQEKEISKYDENKLINIFDKYNITRKEYKELKSNSFSRRNNKNLTLFNQELTKYKNECEISKEKEIRKLCMQFDISILKYEEIKNVFQNDLKFHRSLKSDIDKYLKIKNNE